MRTDRARIQIGRISAVRPARDVAPAAASQPAGALDARSARIARARAASARLGPPALHALRAIEEKASCRRASEIVRQRPPNVALYLLNQKRHSLSEIEQRYNFTVIIEADDELHAADCEIERVRFASRGSSQQRPTGSHELARASYEEASGDEAPSDDAEGSEGPRG